MADVYDVLAISQYEKDGAPKKRFTVGIVDDEIAGLVERERLALGGDLLEELHHRRRAPGRAAARYPHAAHRRLSARVRLTPHALLRLKPNLPRQLPPLIKIIAHHFRKILRRLGVQLQPHQCGFVANVRHFHGGVDFAV